MASALQTFGNRLPVGFVHKDVRFDSFELGDVRGRLRRELVNVASHPAKVLVTALKHALARLGTLEAPPVELVRFLPMPDVEYVNFVMTARTCGDEIPLEIVCGGGDPELGCGAEIKARVRAQDVGALEGTSEILFDKLGRPYQVLRFTTPHDGREVEVRYRVSTLADQEALIEKARATRMDGDTTFHQLSALMLDWDGRGKGLSVEELDALPVYSIDALLEASKNHHAPQLDTDVEVQCERCARIHVVDLPTDRWLAPFGGTRPSRS